MLKIFALNEVWTAVFDLAGVLVALFLLMLCIVIFKFIIDLIQW